jgi:transposase
MQRTRTADQSVKEYFASPQQPLHRQYLALRRFLFEEASAKEVAAEFGYTTSTIYTLARNFKKRLACCTEDGMEPFFKVMGPGRPKTDREGELASLVVELRKKQLSVPDIKVISDSRGLGASEGLICAILRENGFVRLPKRGKRERQELSEASGLTEVMEAAVAETIAFEKEEVFASNGVGVLAFLPLIRAYGIDKAIEGSSYPETGQIDKTGSILSFLALKLSDVERYGHDDGWCMDRGLGMFAGLNVLPKTTWYSTYSSAVTREQNVAFQKALNGIWNEYGLLSDTANLDFTAIPYWGDGDPFENNWSGKRSKALISIQAALAQDPDSGIISYGDATVKHDNQNAVVLEFLDFYQKGAPKRPLTHLVFDSQFTTLENLGRLNEQGVFFLTIQRKGKNLNSLIDKIPPDQWKKACVERANHKSRTVFYHEGATTNPRYGDSPLRQVFIKGDHARPSTVITNDFGLSAAGVIRKYASRWLVENEIAEQIHFFHLNRNSSGIVVKVDFDLTMTLLAHNLYRLMAMGLPGYSHQRAKSIFNGFIDNYGNVEVGHDSVTVKLNRKRALPILREHLSAFSEQTYPWIGNKRLVFEANTHS